MPEKDELRSRAFWSGTITFGLVSIPVNLFSGARSHRVALRMLDQDGTPLSRRFFCPKHDKEVDYDDIVRGYEIADGKFVVVTDDELEALEPRKSRDIDLRRFVDADAIDPMFFERPYFLTPDGDSTKAYKLLAASLEEHGRAGIATFVMRGKEYLVAITAENGILRADTLRFADQLRTPADVGLAKTPKARAADVTRMEKLVKSHSSARPTETELKDDDAEKLMKLIRRKERRKEDVIELDDDVAEAEAPDPDVIDLMQVLRRSLNAQPAVRTAARKSPRKAAKKAARKKKPAKKTAARGRKAS